MIAKLKSKLKAVFKKVLKQDGGEFAKRIRHRNSEFWGSAEGKMIKAVPMDASTPLAEWQNINNWQRRLSNKHNSIEFAKKFGCRVPMLYWEGKDLADFRSKSFPEHYVVKPTLGAGSKLVFLMNGTYNLMDKQTYTKEEIIQKLDAALEKDARLQFIVEEFLKSEQGDYVIPNDYKFYMFNGEIACIQVINRLSPNQGFTTCYDEHWNQIERINTYYPEGEYQEPPACLNEMIGYAKTLSQAYGIFVRIDFYATDKGACFGEFTPTPFMGKGFTPASEKMLVDYWDKYCPGMV